MRRSPHNLDDAKARAVRWLTAWDSQGVHRTGTAGDEAGARWLADEAAGLGVEVASEVFALDRLDPVDCYLELDGERISGVPVFDAPVTGADGLTGALTLSGHEDAILVAKLSPRSVYTGEYEKLRRSAEPSVGNRTAIMRSKKSYETGSTAAPISAVRFRHSTEHLDTARGSSF